LGFLLYHTQNGKTNSGDYKGVRHRARSCHHVQHMVGIPDKMEGARSGAGEPLANIPSVPLELQADCLAAVWAYHADRTRQVIEAGDIEEAPGAARRSPTTNCGGRHVDTSFSTRSPSAPRRSA
jgi:hypothetical protein